MNILDDTQYNVILSVIECHSHSHCLALNAKIEKKLQFITLLTAIVLCFKHRKQQKMIKVIFLPLAKRCQRRDRRFAARIRIK